MELQLRVGGKYLDGYGETVEIVGMNTNTHKDTHPFWGSNSVSYTLGGRFGLDNISSAIDLVEEVTDSAQHEAAPADVMQPPFEGDPADCALQQAIPCYVILRDTPDIVALPSNTYSAILKCGTLEVLTADEEENQVALFAPNSWVAYVNKEPVND